MIVISTWLMWTNLRGRIIDLPSWLEILSQGWFSYNARARVSRACGSFEIVFTINIVYVVNSFLSTIQLSLELMIGKRRVFNYKYCLFWI